jgi:hypothetical protein
MPRSCSVDPLFGAKVTAQDGLVSRDQTFAAGLTKSAIASRLQRDWQRVLPGVYLTHRGTPTRRQLLVAALLYAGSDAAIDGLDACRFHGVKAIIPTTDVHVVVPWGHPARSFGWLIVRRSKWPIVTVGTALVRYVDAATASMTVARACRQEHRALAILSDCLQRRLATHEELLRAHALATPRNALLIDNVLAALSTGVRSVGENDFRLLAVESRQLPALLYNCLLRLPNSRLISPDALCPCCAVVHETNGRRPHAREDQFESMQERHDVMTAAGLTPLHNSPRRIRVRGNLVIDEFIRTHNRYAGRGLPPDVVLLRPAAD